MLGHLRAGPLVGTGHLPGRLRSAPPVGNPLDSGVDVEAQARAALALGVVVVVDHPPGCLQQTTSFVVVLCISRLLLRHAVRSVLACPMPTDTGSSSSPTWGLALTLLIVFANVAFFLVFLPRRIRKKYGGPPKFVGPPLAGTGRIFFVSRQGRGHPPLDAKYPPIRSIRLEVTIPGHKPYDATATQEIPVPILYRIDPHGGTVAVQVDSTNLKYVRIDFDQPIT
jgi:hypothetical protein